MIDSVFIDGVASYSGRREELRDLAEFNFIYGPNGSGKTTISRLLADISSRPSCSLMWKNGREMETHVYNRDFVARVFLDAVDLPGIFSLGEATADLMTRIEDTKANVQRLKEERDNLNAVLDGEDGSGGKRGELLVAKETLTDACWQGQLILGTACKDAFRGFRGSKPQFVEGVLSRTVPEGTATRTKQYLQERAETIFGEPPLVVAQLAVLDCSSLTAIGNPPILAKVIVGTKDIGIGAIIEKLGNSDWVKSGQALLVDSDGQCPFCQQTLPASLEKDLNDYFDETYLNDIAEIATLQGAYDTAADEILRAIDTILADPPVQLDATKVRDKRDVLSARLTTNKGRMKQKKKEPSSVVTLEDTKSLTDEVTALVQSAMDNIATHNLVVRNHAAEKTKLTDECWKYLLDDELKTELSTYRQKKSGIEKAIEGLDRKLAANRSELIEANRTLSDLQKQTTSIEPTISAINGVLSSFGFDGFKLATAETPHCYKLVRSDGSDAKGTLSEGERTFITFLYFYNRIQGSLDESGVMSERVIVFDDPVSSLDSDVLFIVSTLIKRIQQDEVDPGFRTSS